MRSPSPFDALEARLAVVDPDRLAAARFAPAIARARLTAIYALNDDAARVREVVSEAMVGEIRLAWWREAVLELAADPSRARPHPVVTALKSAFAPAELARLAPRLEALVDARRVELYDLTFDDPVAIAVYVDATAGALAQTAADAIAGPEVAARWSEGLALAGRAWGHARLAAGFAALRTRFRTDTPDEARARLLDAAQAAFAEARAALKGAPASVWPAFGYVSLTPLIVDHLRAANVDAQAATPSPLNKGLRLVMSSFTGAL